MHSVKVSSKNQVTLPIEICRKLNVKKGSRLFMEIKDSKIIITLEPENYTEHYYSMAKGTYGKTVEEIDAYVQEEREVWD
ncbi:MAG TPA: AbrB/MazE/SpoVT family DNA-binding domain-containing protein [Clostridia bacterium]|jgi:AbrB family looped-hinge helix DNA binding protein|nr:AbrB/MazE/SpoVT family DNA-binding domain-containing protein [Clostridia bacterium]HHY06748.1 AbrB/MazE/SpoVT family DNA-binding domain-containing protein [Clostridia bacterium]